MARAWLYPSMAADVRIGISGWRYEPWRRVFYPPGLPQHAELAFASSRLRSIEINGSFYSLQRPSSWQRWHAETPNDFVFAVKGSRFLTHMKKLRDCAVPLANFFASGILTLEQKLGPVLWQLPPQLPFDRPRLEEFLSLLPRSTGAASILARGHDRRVGGTAFDVRANRPIRYAMEVRHRTFADPAFFDVLRDAGVALCIADTAGRWPLLDAVTADFVYVRLHGAKRLYVSGYSASALDAWADRIAVWSAQGRDVFVYFDNDAKVHAPFDAMNLAARFGQGRFTRFPIAARRRAEAARRGRESRTASSRWRARPA